MNAMLTTIKTAYEVSGMTPAQIAEDQGWDETAVKAALSNCSAKYRRDCGQERPDEEGLNFTDDQLMAVNQVIFETALSAELSDGSIDYKTRLAAAQYVRDDKKGRKEVQRQLAGNTFNILQFNEQLANARALGDKLRQKLIEV